MKTYFFRNKKEAMKEVNYWAAKYFPICTYGGTAEGVLESENEVAVYSDIDVPYNKERLFSVWIKEDGCVSYSTNGYNYVENAAYNISLVLERYVDYREVA